GARGSVMASDAFFPFPDVVEAAGAAGVSVIVQPGGSIRDDASIEAANRYGIAMVFTGRRHFRHWLLKEGFAFVPQEDGAGGRRRRPGARHRVEACAE